jgi:hypothetical protein
MYSKILVPLDGSKLAEQCCLTRRCWPVFSALR